MFPFHVSSVLKRDTLRVTGNANRSKTDVNDYDPPCCGSVKIENGGFVAPTE